MNNNELTKLLINVLLRGLIALCAGFLAFCSMFFVGAFAAVDENFVVLPGFFAGVIAFFTIFFCPKIMTRLLSRFQNKA